MKKIILVGLLAFSSVALIPTDICAQKSNDILLAQNRKVVFRSNQKLKCSKTGEEIWFFTNGTYKIYQSGVLSNYGTYSISGSYVTLFDEDGNELLHCTIRTNRQGNISSLSFGGDTYYPM